MVRVIGKDPKVLSTVTCSACSAILEYSENDIQEFHGTDYGGGPAGSKWIVCSGCGVHVVLESW